MGAVFGEGGGASGIRKRCYARNFLILLFGLVDSIPIALYFQDYVATQSQRKCIGRFL